MEERTKERKFTDGGGKPQSVKTEQDSKRDLGRQVQFQAGRTKIGSGVC